jgi:hypothetical protein
MLQKYFHTLKLSYISASIIYRVETMAMDLAC